MSPSDTRMRAFVRHQAGIPFPSIGAISAILSLSPALAMLPNHLFSSLPPVPALIPHPLPLHFSSVSGCVCRPIISHAAISDAVTARVLPCGAGSGVSGRHCLDS